MGAVIEHDVMQEIAMRYAALTEFVPLKVLQNEHDYQNATASLNQLLDAGGADQNSPLANIVSCLGAVFADYESNQINEEPASPVDVLRFLMEQHQLKQSELPEIGSQGVVSEVLRGIRELNVRQIRALSERFHVPAAVFI